MSPSSDWLLAPKVSLHRGRQSLTETEHREILAPLAAGARTAFAMQQLRDAVFAGERINQSEQRMAGHWALRAAGLEEAVEPTPAISDTGKRLIAGMRDSQDRAKSLANAIREGQQQSSTGQPFETIVHLGIGGSDLGPQLILQALTDESHRTRFTPIFLSNLDYHGIDHLLAPLNPATTCVIVVSKSFRTQETMINASHLVEWMRQAGINNPKSHFIGVTAATEQARAWGLRRDQILSFDESIGGRYSLWGPVSLIARIVLGNTLVDRFLTGGVMMDRHFLQTPLTENMPAVLAVTDFYNLRTRRIPTLMVSAYDSRLSLLVPYLKQLWMESLGKHLDQKGRPLDGPACPILWGDIGTNAQHAFFQLLHQGAQGVAVELLGVVKPSHQQRHRHQALLANLIAQAQALSTGQTQPDPSKTCWGGHPVNLMMMDTLDPETLGALLALWEHRVLCLAAITGINPFDQWGVELGKSIAVDAETLLRDSPEHEPSQIDAISQDILDWIKRQTG
jgi:glucose-6-phosphate isomerase